MKLQGKIKNLTFTAQLAAAKIKYFHIILLAFAFGRNGFMISILGISFSIAWNAKSKEE